MFSFLYTSISNTISFYSFKQLQFTPLVTYPSLFLFHISSSQSISHNSRHNQGTPPLIIALFSKIIVFYPQTKTKFSSNQSSPKPIHSNPSCEFPPFKSGISTPPPKTNTQHHPIPPQSRMLVIHILQFSFQLNILPNRIEYTLSHHLNISLKIGLSLFNT